MVPASISEGSCRRSERERRDKVARPSKSSAPMTLAESQARGRAGSRDAEETGGTEAACETGERGGPSDTDAAGKTDERDGRGATRAARRCATSDAVSG